MNQTLRYLFWEVLKVGFISRSPIYGNPVSYLLELMTLNPEGLQDHIDAANRNRTTAEISLNGAGLKMIILKVGPSRYLAQVCGDQADLYPEFVDNCTTMLKEKKYFPVNDQE